jgi:transposase
MKRQHPTDPNLFLCKKCKEYMVRDRFSINFATHKGRRYGPYMSSWCSRCKKEQDDTHGGAERRREWRYAKLKSDPVYVKECKRRYQSNACKELRDWYIRKRIKGRSALSEITPVIIELTRQQIEMKRTLKQLKKWRAEHESDRDVISGEQCKDEAVDEIHRGCEEAGHGSNFGLSAGM